MRKFQTCLKTVWNIRSIYDKLHFDNILLLEAMLTNRLRRKPTSKRKKFQVKDWCRILGSEILHYEEFYCNLCQSQRKTNYTRQNENSFDSLASN